MPCTPNTPNSGTSPESILREENKPLPVWVEISLPHGHMALVDVEDLDLIRPYKWRARKDKLTWYAEAPVRDNGKKTSILMHRLILGAGPGEEGDHRNGNGLDNRRFNLRRCTRQQNAQHALRLRSDNTAGFKGVTWDRAVGKWRAQIYANGTRHTIGRFATAEAAAAAYDKAAQLYFGEFAAPNSKIRSEVIA